jgi:4-hydroxybenzoyl-CoA reductase subunit beta
MMRLPWFRYVAPRTVDEATKWLADSPNEAMVLAGGTDLLPNMKRRQQTPRLLVALRRIQELRDRRVNGAVRPGLSLGAAVTLTELVRDPQVQAACPGLWQAAAQVATPHLRNMATLGGNLCLDTRCTYYDQTHEWRKSIDFCMKKDGDTCWVATSSPKCLAVSSTDTAPMLQALDGSVRLVSSAGDRVVKVADLYHNDGMQYMTKRPDELLTDVIVPNQTGRRSAYWKLRRRGSFAAAVSTRLDGDVVADASIVLGAVASRPLPSDKARAVLVGERLTDEAIEAAANAAYEIAKPMDNTDFELVWRKRMVKTLVTSALREIRGDDVRDLRLRLARQTLQMVS